MTTWLKKIRLYLLRRQLKAVTSDMQKLDPTAYTLTWTSYCDWKADLIDRIAALEKTL